MTSNDIPRSNPRFAVDAFVRLSEGAGEYVFRTRDISADGLFLYTRVAHTYPFKIGAHLDLELYDYQDKVACVVEVVRIVKPNSAEASQFPFGFGVKISSISPEDQVRLQTLIGKLKGGSAFY